jgi:hypothetical protein
MKVFRSACKVPDIFVRFKPNFAFLYRFSQKSLISNFMEIRLVGTVVLHAGNTKLIGSFCYLCQRAQRHTGNIHTFLHFFTLSCLT